MPGKRSDPKKLAADREAIARSLEGFVRNDRVKRSQAKAKADAEAFKATGEGTLREAWQNLVDSSAEERYIKKHGGPPSLEGAAVTGFKKNNSPV